MKKLMLIIASLFLTTSFVSANPIQSDLDLAFGGVVKAQQITLLNDTQMSEIKGKGWGSRFKRSIKKARRSVKKFGKKINWNKNRYRYIMQIGGAVLWVYGVPVSPSATGFNFTYVLPST
jgi:hypothetical protein